MRATVAVINLEALEKNLVALRNASPNKSVLAMVKANAYGHGMVEVSHVLQRAGVEMLGTAFVDEAIQLRKSGIHIPIAVLTPVEPSEAEYVVEHQLTTIAADIEQVRALSAESKARNKCSSVHVYVDTGMSREGFRADQVLESVEMLASMPGISLDGICTHFATSDEPQSPFLEQQLSTFERVLSDLRSQGRTFATVHAANSGAIMQLDQSHFTMIRPGLSLYGYAPKVGRDITLHPVMQIVSRIVALRRILPGDTVSYGRRFMANTPTTIATVPIGYGDGYLRSLSGSSQCIIGGCRYPIVGTICMDEVMVDVGDASLLVGDEVVLMGEQAGPSGAVERIGADELAQWAGTIPYEITTAVSTRVPRVFIPPIIFSAQRNV